MGSISSIKVNGIDHPIDDLRKNDNALLLALAIAFGKKSYVDSGKNTSYKVAITDSNNNVIACKLFNDTWEFSDNLDSVLEEIISSIDYTEHDYQRNNISLIMSLAFKVGTTSIKDTDYKFVITDSVNNILCAKTGENEWYFAISADEIIDYLINNMSQETDE